MKNEAQTTNRQDVYSRITSQIVASLEQGVRPWVKPWNAAHAAGRITRPLRHNGQPYSGINILSLWMSAELQGFPAPIWTTFRQALELDAHVRKGEKGSLVVYANTITRTERDDKTGQDVEHEIPYMKGYTVFNVEQIDGLPEIYYAKAAPTLDPVARIDHAEKFFEACKAAIKHGGNRAFYAQELDYVQMPPFECFRDAESYYSTLAHEMTHWTKHFHLHFIPTSSSWLNLVERWFGKLREKRIRRGSFFSVEELVQAINEYLEENNRQPKPFIWTASVEKILAKVNRCKAILETEH